MAWADKKKPSAPPADPSSFWKPAKDIVHEQGLKVLAWGDTEVGNRN